MITKWQGTEVDMFKHHIKLRTLIRHFILRKNVNSLYIGNWSEHVNYWIEFPNACVVKYEDLLADTYYTLKKSFRKIGINYSEQRIVEAIDRQSFLILVKKSSKKMETLLTHNL